MSLDDLLPILLPVLIVLILLVLIVLLLRRSRRRAAQRAAARRARAKASSAPATSDEDEQLIASLTASAHPAVPTAVPEPAPKRLAEILVPPPVAPEPPPSPKITPLSSASRTADKIHILVVDDHRDTRENVSRLIAFEPDMEVIGQAYNGRKGLEMAIELQPEIVMMDINMPDMDGITATREMTMRAPYCQVIMMSVQIEREYMRNAMLAGARDYQTKPFTGDELINCIRRVYQVARPNYQQIKEARSAVATSAVVPTEVAIMTGPANVPNVPVFAVYSPRGGSGKSAIAIHLAVALQHEHPGVVLIDADLQWGDIPIHLNMPPTATIENLIPRGRPEPDLLPTALLPHSSGIKLLLAPQKPEMADLITANTMIQVIRTVKSQASAIVIDTPSYLTDHNLAVMEAADLTLLVITPDLPSVKNARLFLDLAFALDLKPDRFALVINRAATPGGLPPQQIQKLFTLPHIYTIPDDPKMPLSGLKGVAIYQLSPTAPSGIAIAQMAHQVWQSVAAPAPPK
ncbi:MAG TPA: response regulator [Anaerolineae bacterium]